MLLLLRSLLWGTYVPPTVVTVPQIQARNNPRNWIGEVTERKLQANSVVRSWTARITNSTGAD